MVSVLSNIARTGQSIVDNAASGNWADASANHIRLQAMRTVSEHFVVSRVYVLTEDCKLTLPFPLIPNNTT